MSKLKVDELEESTSGQNITVASGTNLVVTDSLTVGGAAPYTAGGTDVAVADGGTGAGTATAGFDALSPMTTVGDIMYGGSSGTVTRLAASTDGHVLTSTGAGSAPAWEAAAAGGASIDVANVGFKTIAGGNVTIAADTTSNIGTFTAGTTLPGGWFYVCYANEVEHANSNESAVANVSTSKRTSGTYNQSLEVLKSYADNSPADTGGWLMSGATLQLRNPYDASRIFRYCIYRVFGTDDNDGFS